MGACFVVALAASVYLVLVLEILKLRRLRAWQLRHADPDTTEHEIDAEVERELETGEFRALDPNVELDSGFEPSNRLRKPGPGWYRHLYRNRRVLLSRR